MLRVGRTASGEEDTCYPDVVSPPPSTSIQCERLRIEEIQLKTRGHSMMVLLPCC
jgi:hypothetical protein